MRKIILFVYIALGLVHQGWSQNKSIDSLRIAYDQSYGLDVILINGKKYFPNSNPVTSFPFWKSKDSFSGDITISGKTFNDQQLKYELNKQQFVLCYSNYKNQSGQIILNNLSIDSVRMGKWLFIPNKNPDVIQPFVQLIFKGNVSCYIAWYKELKFNTIGPDTGLEYSKEYAIRWLSYKGSDYRFKNKSSFLKVFSRKNRVSIRKYITAKRLNFKTMNEDDLRTLISFCDQTSI